MSNKALIKRLRRWFRFVLGGSINTFFTFGIYLILNAVVEYQIAYLVAYVTGVIFSYWFNSVYVFCVPLSWKSFFSYPLVYMVQYGVSALFLGGLVELAVVSEFFAPLVVTIMMIPVTYGMNKLLLVWVANKSIISVSGDKS